MTEFFICYAIVGAIVSFVISFLLPELPMRQRFIVWLAWPVAIIEFFFFARTKC